MSPLTPEQAYKIVQAVGPEAANLSPENPYALSSATARKLQATIQARDPQLAQQLIAEVPASMGYLAVKHAVSQGEDVYLDQLPESVKQGILLRDYDQLQAQQQAAEQALLDKMEADTQAIHQRGVEAGYLASDRTVANQQNGRRFAQFEADAEQQRRLADAYRAEVAS